MIFFYRNPNYKKININTILILYLNMIQFLYSNNTINISQRRNDPTNLNS